MVIWTAVEKLYDETLKKHAGGKARDDLEKIFLKHGIKNIDINSLLEERKKANKIDKLKYHYQVGGIWKEALKKINKGDILIIQFPVVNHTFMLRKIFEKIRKKQVRIIAFIHDLEILRMSNDKEISNFEKWRMRKEELDVLYLFDQIVVHNESMKNYMNDVLDIPLEKMIVLQIFDYLLSDDFIPLQVDEKDYKKCIIAGNLARNKAEYVYKLPALPNFELYGINYEEILMSNINYHGSYYADELPFHLCGGFGLVWDGDDIDTCSGVWGNYLKYNNPHKVSLYLACGIPVIIWDKAALADFIISNKVGITISSLKELYQRLNEISFDEYKTLKMNAIALSKKITIGYYTKKALKYLGISPIVRK